MIDLARWKDYNCPVQFSLLDAHSLSFRPGVFDAAVATFWFSHVPRERVAEFLEGLHRVLGRNSTVFLADNVYVSGLGGCLLKQEGGDNTYKRRRFSDGTEHKVLKNYYSLNELTALIGASSKGAAPIDTFFGNYYWYVAYRCP